MSARCQTPLLVDVKIEELRSEENITFIPFVQCKAKMHHKKFTLSLPLGVMSNSLTQRQF